MILGRTGRRIPAWSLPDFRAGQPTLAAEAEKPSAQEEANSDCHFPDEAGTATGSSSDNGAEPLSSADKASRNGELLPPAASALRDALPHPAVHRSTGPRTPEGKQRSKRNALKHGIFSSVAVLKGESPAECQSLLKGLRESCQPGNKLEELLVDKLAEISWRHRRLIIAEAAEIQKNVQFMKWDQEHQHREEAEEIGSSSALAYEGGLIRKIQNPNVLNRCLELLAELYEDFEADSFTETDSEVLKTIYGEADGRRLNENLYDEYLRWFYVAGVSIVERHGRGYSSPEECKQIVLKRIDEEIRRLKRHRKARAAIEADRIKLEALCRSVPEPGVLDRLLRYEAHLERAFDRNLSQLERMQRARLGHPPLPEIRVNLSNSD